MKTPKKNPVLPFLLILLSSFMVRAQAPTMGNPEELPYTIRVEDVTRDEIPGLHSFAFAQWDGWWVVICGRINGLHGFFPFTAFPENGINASIRIIDPETGEMYSYAIDDLDLPYPGQLKSTNPQYAQEGEWLYIAGGYGKMPESDDFITFPTLTRVHLPSLITNVIWNENPSAAFRQIQSPEMQVCGGEMDLLDDYFYLVGGHDFAGNYSQTQTSTFTQEYTYEIRKFKIEQVGDSLGITNYTVYHDEENLRRRDFSLAPIVQPNGNHGLCLYGGVFRPDADLPYYNPVYITDENIFEMDADYEQVFSQYTCPTIPLFDAQDQSMYTLFFGGLSVHYYQQNDEAVYYDERVPFIKDITTFRRQADGSSLEFLMPQYFDELLGSNMIFVPNLEAPHYNNEVFKLQEMSGEVFLGYLFGGIKAEIPNITPSSASNRMFKVYIQHRPIVQTNDPLSYPTPVSISPNPFTSHSILAIEAAQPIENLQLFHSNGTLLGQFGNDQDALERRLLQLPRGIYFVRINGGMVRLVRG